MHSLRNRANVLPHQVHSVWREFGDTVANTGSLGDDGERLEWDEDIRSEGESALLESEVKDRVADNVQVCHKEWH